MREILPKVQQNNLVRPHSFLAFYLAPRLIHFTLLQHSLPHRVVVPATVRSGSTTFQNCSGFRRNANFTFGL
jgi:hypothetical protein